MNEFSSALTAAAVAYGVPLAPERIEVYWQILQHYGEQPLVRAIRVYLTLPTSRFFPVPADLISIMEGEHGDDEGQALAAWADVTAGRDPKDQHATAAINALGGWYALQNSTEPGHFQRRAFVKAYQHSVRSLRLEEREAALGAPRLGQLKQIDRPVTRAREGE